MSVVYAATHVETGLPAAFKVLSEKAFTDPDHRRRFLAESRAATSLHHDNIVRVHETGSVELDGATVQYIAMDRIDGESLEARLRRGAVPHREAARISVAIAAALDSAHAAGIAHRDLKPGNVMIARDGAVKVLDFGLAKRIGFQAAAGAQTEAIAESVTIAGTIVGTVAYMAPEQAEGKPVDHRADIFSLGAVLYEMLSGRRAFGGDSQLVVISAVLAKEPEPLPESVPAGLRRLVERCLRKDPRRRVQSMADVRAAIEDVLAETGAARGETSRRRIVGTLAGAGLGAAAGIGAARFHYRREPANFQRLTYRRGDVMYAQFGPNGAVVYSAAWDVEPPKLFVAQPGNREASPASVPPCNILSVSSKSELAILLGSERLGTLAVVPFGGGTPKPVLENVGFADWAPDGDAMAIARRTDRRFRVEYPIGAVLHESDRPNENVRVSPDGRSVAFFAIDNASGDYSITVCGPDRKARAISRGWRAAGGLEWSPGGRELFFSASRTGGEPAVHAVSMSGEERVVFKAPGWLHLMDIGPHGEMLMAAASSRLGIVAKTPFRNAPRDLAWLEASRVFDLSADGTELLFAELSYGDGRNAAIYRRRTDGSPAVRVGVGNRASLSADGKWAACVQAGDRGPHLALLPTGIGEARVLAPDGIRYESAEPFADGRRLLCAGAEQGKGVRAWIRAIDGERPEPVTPEGVRATKLAPGERAAVSIEQGRFTLRPFDGSAPRPIADAREGEAAVRWSGDGRHLFVAAQGSGSVSIARIEVASGRREKWLDLEPPEPGAVFWASPVLSADGQYYAASFRRDTSDLYLVTGLE